MTTFRFRFFAAIALATVASEAFANFLVELPQQEKWKRAELVVIAQPTNCPSRKWVSSEPCQFKVIETLKGPTLSSITLERQMPIAEESLGNYNTHQMYLMYLSHGRNGLWYSVNGYHAVRELKPIE